MRKQTRKDSYIEGTAVSCRDLQGMTYQAALDTLTVSVDSEAEEGVSTGRPQSPMVKRFLDRAVSPNPDADPVEADVHRFVAKDDKENTAENSMQALRHSPLTVLGEKAEKDAEAAKRAQLEVNEVNFPLLAR